MGRLLNQLRELWRVHKEIREMNRKSAEHLQEAMMKSRIYRELGKVKEAQIRKQMDNMLRLAALSNRVHKSIYIRKHEKELKRIGAIAENRSRSNDIPEERLMNIASEVEFDRGSGLLSGLKNAWRFASKAAEIEAGGGVKLSEETFKEELINKATKIVAKKGKGVFTEQLMQGMLRDGFSRIKLDSSKGRIDMLTNLGIGMAKDAGMSKKEVLDFLGQFDSPETARDDAFLKRKIEENWSKVEVAPQKPAPPSSSHEQSKLPHGN